DRVRLRRGDRNLLRLLPGPQSLAPGSDRSTPLRIAAAEWGAAAVSCYRGGAMARARRRRRKTKTRRAVRIVRRALPRHAPAKQRPAARAPRPVRIVVPKPSRAETLLLTLARDLAGAPLDRALRTIADAFAPGAELPREVFNAWIKTRREKTASLA